MWVAFVQLLLVATIVLAIGHSRDPLNSDAKFYWKLGRSIAASGSMSVDGVPTTYVTPGYPFLVGGVQRLAGPRPWVVLLLQAVMLVACGLVVRWIADSVGARPVVGIAVQALVPLYPLFLLAAASVLTETTFALLVGVCVVAYLWALATPPDSAKARAMVLAGAIAASFVLVAVRPTGVVLLGAIFSVAAVAWWRDRGAHARFALAIAVAMLCGAVVFVGVWGARNVVTMGRFIPFSSEGSLVAYRGNLIEGGGNDGRAYGASVDAATRDRIENGSELQRSDEFGRLFAREVRERPLEILRLWAVKPFRFWLNLGFPDPPSRFSLAIAAANSLILFAAGMGLIAMIRSADPYSRTVGRLVVLFSVLLMLAHVATWATLRYSYPALMLLSVPAAIGVERVAAAFGGRPVEPREEH